ncbi:MAG: hypothetical protein HYV26_11045, partial [Candidatus Hydrogenedentes bacterium]|nr:hypothetical protein [Candidatus Hydrogenedentota bacterium]
MLGGDPGKRIPEWPVRWLAGAAVRFVPLLLVLVGIWAVAAPGSAGVLASNAGSDISFLEANSRYVFLAASDNAHGKELWKYDPATQQTSLVKNINLMLHSSDPGQFFIWQDILYFVAATETESRELWRSDGSAEGTWMVRDINQQRRGSSNPALFRGVGNLLLFTADDGIHGAELWRSDGTTAGTEMVKDIHLPNQAS